MRKHVLIAFLMIVSALFIEYIGTSFGDVKEAEMPRYSVGDYWKIRIDYAEVEGIGMLCTKTYEITQDSVDFTQFGRSYVCYEIDIKGNGSLYGVVSGTFAINGKNYVSKPDWGIVKFTETYDGSFVYVGETHSMYQVFKITNNPPLEKSKGFPLTVGKSWSAPTTETYTKKTTIDGQLEQETNTTTGIESYLVHRTELITVPAGEFDTFVVKVTHLDGSYAEWYYSPEVGEAVKQIEYYQTGELKATMELLEYNYASAKGEFPWFWLTIVVVIAVTTATSVVAYVLYKRRKQPSPLAPPIEQPSEPIPT